MAIQGKDGKIKGKVNNIVYRELGDQQIMQAAPGDVKQTYASQLSALEFGLASAHGKVLRMILQMEYEVSDSKMNARLNAAIAACLRSSDKEIGERSLHHVDLDALKGFEFNLDAPIASLIAVRPIYGVEPDGTFHFELPSFHVIDDIAYPPGDIRMNPNIAIGLVAIHFEEALIQVIDHKRFTFENIDQRAEIIWKCQKRLPKGFVVVVTLSLRYSAMNWLGREIWATDRAFMPTILLDAFHVSDDMAAQSIAAGFDSPKDDIARFGFKVSPILNDIKRFKEKMG